LTELAELLERHRENLVRYMRAHAGWLRRFESTEDLAHGCVARALGRQRSFSYRGPEAFRGWLFGVARSHLADRSAHWSALKRRPSRLLRLTQSGEDPNAAREPPRDRTGPATFAARREQLRLAVRALGALLPRDQKIVRWTSEGLTVAEQAEQLGIGPEAAKKAHARALDRFRKAYLLASEENRRR